ncbi:MAG: S9 family peptidase [Gemmatimonadetes bacterium]|nr:S9 family peptidase [Gemmatimonadota bacterium]
MKAIVVLLAALVAVPALAQQAPRTLTAADYARAEKYLGYNTNPLVTGAGVRPTWLPDERFWYRNTTADGFEFILVDPAKKTRARAFDHAKLAAVLSRAADTTFDGLHLPFSTIELSAGGAVSFDAKSRHWTCTVLADRARAGEYACVAEPPRQNVAPRNSVTSPDGKRAAFIRDWNLWVKDLETTRETRMTADGIKDFGYATDNAGWTASDRPVLLWSPDSKKIATFQQDDRGVQEMYLVDTKVGHSTLKAWKYPLVGDSIVSMITRVVIDVDLAKAVRLQLPPDFHRSTTCDHISCGGGLTDVEWAPDSKSLAFVSTSRDHKTANLRVADAQTGAIRDVLEEKVADFFESGAGRVNWHVLPATNEVVWFSARDDWGHLYLYDLTTGKLKNRITSGNWNVQQVRRIDEKTRAIFFTGNGREPGDPYYRRFYSVRMDGTGLALLAPEDADHDITLSASGAWFVDSWSRPDVPPIAVVRDAQGKTVVGLEKADISRLLASGWSAPISFTVKARDGKTDLYGLMFRPTTFDSTKKYPIVNHIYPGPQTGSVGSRTFNSARSDARALAELGFIVIQLDAMGTPGRSHSFHTAYYGNMGDNGLPDQVGGMQQLAKRYSWIDLDKAGIWGHSGGGFATADAMFRYPDFFKVGISEAGNHDNREYEDDWGEKYHGLLERRPDGTTNYDSQANQSLAKNLKGKLLLAHGTMDNNVPPDNTLLVVNELIKANKDFDLLMLPNRNHGFGNEPYMVRRRWDYFVKYLMGAEPPKEYELRPTPPPPTS